MYLKSMSASGTVHCNIRGGRRLTFAAQSERFPLCSLASIGQDREALSGPPRSSSLSHLSSIDRLFIDYYLPRSLVDAGDVDGGHELNSRRVVRIVWSTVNVHTVYPVLMDALYQDPASQARAINQGRDAQTYVRRAQDCSIPVAHHHVLSISKTIRTSFCNR